MPRQAAYQSDRSGATLWANEPLLAPVLLLVLALLAGGCARLPAEDFGAPAVAVLQAEAYGFDADQGVAVFALYRNPRGFPGDVTAAVATRRAAIQGRRAVATFPPLPVGEYALAVHHDADADGRMARGWLGAPWEGRAISRDAAGFLGPPDFADASFHLLPGEQIVRLRIRYGGGFGSRRRSPP